MVEKSPAWSWFCKESSKATHCQYSQKNSQMPRHLISGWEIWMSHNSYDYALAKSLTIKKLYFHRDEVTRTLFSGNSEVYVQPFSIQINLEIPMTKSASRALQSFVRWGNKFTPLHLTQVLTHIILQTSWKLYLIHFKGPPQ